MTVHACGERYKTNPKDMNDLLVDMQAGTIPLPDFQRGWVHEGMRIRALLCC